MRVLAWRPAMKRPTRTFERRTGFGDAIDERDVRQGDDLRAFHVDVAMQIADHVRDAGGFADVARTHDEDVLVRRRDDVRGFGTVVEQLARMEDRASGELEREYRSVWRLDEPPDAAPVVRAHSQLDDRQIRWRFDIVRQCAYRDWRAWNAHD
jgi:hypothetical protein